MSKNNPLNILGLMSGTSMDGINTTIIQTDGVEAKRFNIHEIYSYSKITNKLLNEAFKNPLKFLSNNLKKNKVSDYVTFDHSIGVKKFLKKHNVQVDLIGFHGQTIYHDYKTKTSIQLGNPLLLAKLLSINVISNFRANDIKNGGQGAPIAPIYHKSIIEEFDLELPSCFLNLGGVGNITFWNGKILLGFDTGPANGLMDYYCFKVLNQKFDTDGILASQGMPNQQIVESFLNDPFFKLNYPKSLDRQHFNYILDMIIQNRMNANDSLATLLDCTIKSIIASINFLPSPPSNIFVMGGGVNNLYLIKTLKKTYPTELKSINEIGLYAEMIEAELIAYIAGRSYYGLPYTFPSTTGVKKSMTGGKKFNF
ncbi:anhydro-N-acetylmuramic acid kinase [Alphaproteobacteria bacterium]|nr:anhydro-N-acetylmuramic acid kinase [Alphaproteobacteria bacterium]